MRVILSLLLISVVHAQEWPRVFKPSPAQEKYQDLGEKDGRYYYRTKHYRIVSEQALKPTLLKNFTRSAESVALVLEKIPLPLSAPPKSDLPRILICANEESFLKAGGPQGAAGFYNGRRKEVLLRWDQFYPDPGGGSRLGPKSDFSLLVHELTHLQMHEYLWKTRPWFYEGVAEYLAAAHSQAGNFEFTKMEEKVRARIKKHTDPKAPGNPVMSLASLVELDSRQWHELAETKEPYELLETYSSALLLTHYYFHGGDERRAEVQHFLEAVQKVRDRREEIPRLLTTKQAEEIQKKLVTYWGPRGLKLNFK